MSLCLVENETVDSLDVAFVIIAFMGLGGVRKLEVELGESAMVMGLGLWGILYVRNLNLIHIIGLIMMTVELFWI